MQCLVANGSEPESRSKSSTLDFRLLLDRLVMYCRRDHVIKLTKIPRSSTGYTWGITPLPRPGSRSADMIT